MKNRGRLWAVVYGLALLCFTAYVILDTFVIQQVYAVVPTEQDVMTDNIDMSASADEISYTTTTDSSYTDNNISITILEYREHNTDIYVADIAVASVEYLKTAFARSSFGRNVTEKTSEIAKSVEAVLAINGDYYGARENGYVLRNGVVYRSAPSRNQEDAVVYRDGSLSIITEGETSTEGLLAGGAWQVLSFGPPLVTDGKISVTENDEVGRAMVSNPRTAIGIVDELHYVFVVTDGRTDESDGLTLYQLAEFMQSIGAATAYNLDGGGSSTMYFNGRVINNPTTNGNRIKERSVSDIVYIGY